MYQQHDMKPRSALLDEARLQESDVVIELVSVSRYAELDRPVSFTLEARAIPARFVVHRLDTRTLLALTRVERRIDVDQGNASIRQILQHRQVVVQDDLAHAPSSQSG